MKVAIWDTNVLREDKRIMHFDIVVGIANNNFETVLEFCKNYIATKPFKTKKLTADECCFCSFEDYNHITHDELLNKVQQQGYAIIEFENCI